MIAILLATGHQPFYGLDEHLPIPLLRLIDRPFLQHVIEYLARRDIRSFEFVLSHLPEEIESHFGDGARWGCSFRYHLAPSDREALRVAAGIVSGYDEEIMLASGTCLPAFELDSLPAGSLLVRGGAWTGWARFASGAQMLAALNPRSLAAGIPDGAQLEVTGPCLSIESGEAFLQAQRDAMSGVFPGLLVGGRESEPGVWISRNVAIHPSASVSPPVYIGENCRIGKLTSIGPYAVVGSDCIVDAHSTVVNSMICPGTYVGEALELDSVIIDRNRLVNLRLGTSVLISETFLLGSLRDRSRGRLLQGLRDRLIALFLLFFLWPVLVAMLLALKASGRGRLAYFEAVELPAEEDPAGWRARRILQIEARGSRPPGARGQALRIFLPGLLSVLKGDTFLVGVQPRSRRQVESLPSDWRSLYLKCKTGLITEADVMFGPAATEDEIYSSEAFYSATESGLRDLKLTALWLRNLFVGHPASAHRSVSDETSW